MKPWRNRCAFCSALRPILLANAGLSADLSCFDALDGPDSARGWISTYMPLRALFHAPAVEIAFIRCILLDIGGLALLGNVLRLWMLHRRILSGHEIRVGPIIAAIG
jgi:hypothetical protein